MRTLYFIYSVGFPPYVPRCVQRDVSPLVPKTLTCLTYILKARNIS